MNQPKKINFKCPKCGNDEIEELLEATQYSVVSAIRPDLDNQKVYLEFSEHEYLHNEEPECYRCNDCNHIIAYSPAALYEWLNNAGMLE